MQSFNGASGSHGLINRIKRRIAPPVFPNDEDKTRRAGMLNLALINILILIPFLIISNLLGGNTPASVIGVDVLVLALCLVLYLLMRRGRIKLASIGLMALGFLGITAGIASLGTIRAPTTAMYLLMIITAGLLFDLGGMIVTTMLCSVLVAGLIMAGNAGMLPTPDYSLTITQWITYTAIFGWAGSLTFSAIQSMHSALGRANKEIVERKMTEAELAKHRDHLEELVNERTGELEEKNSMLMGEIAERKRAEEAMRESEAKYHDLFMNMTEEVHFWKLVRDENGQITTWRLVDANPPALKTWGRTIDEIRGRTTDKIFGPGATEHYMPVVQKVMTEGIPYSYEDYFPNLDRYFRFTSVPLAITSSPQEPISPISRRRRMNWIRGSGKGRLSCPMRRRTSR